jgi:hypothetical protein
VCGFDALRRVCRQVGHTSSSPEVLEMEQLLQAAAEQGAANAEAKLAQVSQS